MTTTTTTTHETSEETVTDGGELTVHLNTCAAEVKRHVTALVNLAGKVDAATLVRVYGGKDGRTVVAESDSLIVWLDKYLQAGGRLTDITPKDEDRVGYDLLSNVKRVLGRFGTARPPRFTSWSAICRAVKLDDAQLAAIEGDSIDVKAVNAAVSAKASASRAEHRESTPDAPAAEADERSGERVVTIGEAPTALLLETMAELVARANEGQLSDDELRSALSMAAAIAKVAKQAKQAA